MTDLTFSDWIRRGAAAMERVADRVTELEGKIDNMDPEERARIVRRGMHLVRFATNYSDDAAQNALLSEIGPARYRAMEKTEGVIGPQARMAWMAQMRDAATEIHNDYLGAFSESNKDEDMGGRTAMALTVCLAFDVLQGMRDTKGEN